MKAYRPKSYSQQARKLATEKIRQFEAGEITAYEMIQFTQTSYRCSLIRSRMAKMFYRYFRKHNIKI